VPGVDLLLRKRKDKERKKARLVSIASSFSIEVCPVSILSCEIKKRQGSSVSEYYKLVLNRSMPGFYFLQQKKKKKKLG